MSGDADAALAAFRVVTEAYPEEVIGWEGLRVAGDVIGDRGVVAEASACLGDAVDDDARGAELWEESAFILIDELGDEARGEFALSRCIARDICRGKAFDKLFRLVRARKDGARLLELIGLRLEVAEDPEEIAKLYWERARVLREAGDRDGALTALENVTLLEPDHVGALALSGEIYLTSGKLPEAAEKLARLSTLSDAPVKQRLMSGVAAVDIYENKLKESDKALEVLDGLYRAGLSTLPVRERLARAAAKTESWQKATEVLEQLMAERETKEGRIEAARLAMVIHRDRLDDPSGAGDAVSRLLLEAPDDGEGLDLVLSGALPEVEAPLLRAGQDALVEALVRDPLDAERVDRLARIAAHINNAPLRQAALGSLVALGEGSAEIDRELSILDQRVAHVPQIVIDPRALPDLCDAEDAGPIAELVLAMATTFSEALGPNLSSFGVGRKERVDPRSGLPVRNEIAAWAGALGIGDFEVYVGGPDDQGIFGVGAEVASVGRGSRSSGSAFAAAPPSRGARALRAGARHDDPSTPRPDGRRRVDRGDLPHRRFRNALPTVRDARRIHPRADQGSVAQGQEALAGSRGSSSRLRSRSTGLGAGGHVEPRSARGHRRRGRVLGVQRLRTASRPGRSVAGSAGEILASLVLRRFPHLPRLARKARDDGPMSNPEDPKPKPKPPTPGGTGRSASARSIGEELGDLDFEPDALLDSLLSDDPHRKPEPARPARSMRRRRTPVSSSSPSRASGMPMASRWRASVEHTAPGPSTGDSVDDLARRCARGAPDPGRATTAGGTPATRGARRDPPARPPAPTDRAPHDPSRPEPADRRGARRPNPPAPAPDEREQHGALGLDEFTEVPPAISSSDADIDALVGGLEPADDALDVAAKPGDSPQSLAPDDVVADEDDQDDSIDEGNLGAEPLWTPANWEQDRPASVHLAEQDGLDACLARAAWFETEAQSAEDVGTKARALLVASELFALAGDGKRARSLANESLALAPTAPLMQRQARLLAAQDADFKTVLAALDNEAKSSASPAVRSHAVYVGAEVARCALKDSAQAIGAWTSCTSSTHATHASP